MTWVMQELSARPGVHRLATTRNTVAEEAARALGVPAGAATSSSTTAVLRRDPGAARRGGGAMPARQRDDQPSATDPITVQTLAEELPGLKGRADLVAERSAE
jgi:hypothetical protein